MKNAMLGRISLVLGIVAAVILIVVIVLCGIFFLFPNSIGTAEEMENASEYDDELDSILAQAQAQAMAEELQRRRTPPPAVLEDEDWVTVDLLPINPFSRPGDPIDEIRGVVIHYTGNPGTTAQQNRNYFAALADSGSDSVSSHFVIGMDGEVIQCVPMDEKAYCSNHRNSDTVSIECCHPDETGELTEETLDSLVRLTRYLAKTYGFGKDELMRHYDVTGKLCPLYYVVHEDEWEALKDRIFSSGAVD